MHKLHEVRIAFMLLVQFVVVYGCAPAQYDRGLWQCPAGELAIDRTCVSGVFIYGSLALVMVVASIYWWLRVLRFMDTVENRVKSMDQTLERLYRETKG